MTTRIAGGVFRRLIDAASEGTAMAAVQSPAAIAAATVNDPLVPAPTGGSAPNASTGKPPAEPGVPARSPPRDSSRNFKVGSVYYRHVQEAYDALNDGGTLLIAAGAVFLDQAGFLRRSRCIIKADAGGQATFKFATVEGKANVVVQGRDNRFESIAWEAMAVSDGNGAGIRLEAPGLTLSGCRFSYCQDGLLTGNKQPDSIIRIDRCGIDHCGGDGGQSHGIYVGSVGSLTVLDTRFSEGVEGGHLLKTRAEKLVVEGCWFNEGGASRSIDICNGGYADINRCDFYQDQRTDNSDIIGYGTETGGKPLYAVNKLFVRRNRLLDTRDPKGTWVNVKLEPSEKIIEPPLPATPLAATPVASAPAPLEKPVVVDFKAASFWDLLPTNTWVEVPNTRLRQVEARLPAGFQELGDTGFTAIMSAWSGAAFDEATGRFYIQGGGHKDSNNNGLYEFDLETMKFRIIAPPTIITQADVEHAKASWKAGGRGWDGFDFGYEFHTDSNEDGTPCVPRHSYGDICFVPGIGVVRGGQVHIWHYDVATGAATIGGDSADGQPTQWMIYDKQTRKIFRCGPFGYEYRAYRIYDPFNKSQSGLIDPGLRNDEDWDESVCQIGREVFWYNARRYVATAMNIDTKVWRSLGHIDGPFFKDPPLAGQVYVEDLRLVLMLLRSGKLGAIDPKTGRSFVYGTGGMPPQKRTANGLFGRIRYYPKRKCLAILPAVDENLRLIRLG